MKDAAEPEPLPRVSLVMATWNGEAHLEAQLASLALQTVPPAELIVFDDASSDGTVGILRRFALTCPFPMEIHQQPRRLGYSRNFACAVARASGELLMFVDQDDDWHPRKLELVAKAAATGTSLLVHDCEIVQSDGEVLIPSLFAHLDRLGIRRELCVKGCCLAVRRNFIEQWGLPPADSGISHDFWIAFLAAATGEWACLDERLIRHRLHGRNASGWIPQPADRAPGLAEALAADPAPAIDALLEMFLKPWRRGWIAPLQAALRERASGGQAASAELAVRKLDLADRWLGGA